MGYLYSSSEAQIMYEKAIIIIILRPIKYALNNNVSIIIIIIGKAL